MKPRQCRTVPKQLTLMNLLFLMNQSMIQVNLQLWFEWLSHWLNQLGRLVIYHLTRSLKHRSLVLTIFNSKWTKNCHRWSQHEMKILPIYFSKWILSYHLSHGEYIFWPRNFRLKMSYLYIPVKLHTSLLTFARPLQLFNPL